MTSAIAAELFQSSPRVVETDGAVAAILAAVAEAARLGVPVHLPRGEVPRVLEGDTGGFAVLLETSGTTGPPKLVRHSLDRLLGRVRAGSVPVGGDAVRWLLTYDPASFAGLQVILTAAVSGAVLVAGAGLGVSTLANLTVLERVTHVSGTPSFWRGFLMACPLSPSAPRPPLRAITLGGEAVDQSLLDHLRAAFPDAGIRHIYASTEVGALFAVSDGRAGFPAAWLADGVDGVSLLVRDEILWVRSPRAMLGYQGAVDRSSDESDLDGDGWIDTGDLVAVEGDRVLFRGRADGRVNVGGVKVSPEEAEALILAVDGVADALVTAIPSPLVGWLLTATIVPGGNTDTERLRFAVRDAVSGLPPAGRPRVITFAEAITLSRSGKKQRTIVA